MVTLQIITVQFVDYAESDHFCNLALEQHLLQWLSIGFHVHVHFLCYMNLNQMPMCVILTNQSAIILHTNEGLLLYFLQKEVQRSILYLEFKCFKFQKKQRIFRKKYAFFGPPTTFQNVGLSEVCQGGGVCRGSDNVQSFGFFFFLMASLRLRLGRNNLLHAINI